MTGGIARHHESMFQYTNELASVAVIQGHFMRNWVIWLMAYDKVHQPIFPKIMS